MSSSDYDTPLTGSIDHLGRMIMQLRLGSLKEPVTLQLDTGFNGTLILWESDARAVGIAFSPTDRRTATLADGNDVHFIRTMAEIEWFGIPRNFPIFIQPGFRGKE